MIEDKSCQTKKTHFFLLREITELLQCSQSCVKQPLFLAQLSFASVAMAVHGAVDARTSQGWSGSLVQGEEEWVGRGREGGEVARGGMAEAWAQMLTPGCTPRPLAVTEGRKGPSCSHKLLYFWARAAEGPDCRAPFQRPRSWKPEILLKEKPLYFKGEGNEYPSAMDECLHHPQSMC